MKILKLGAKEAFDEIKDFSLLRQNCLKKKKSRVSCIEEYFNVSFRENRISITAAMEEQKTVKNLLTANIILDTTTPILGCGCIFKCFSEVTKISQ